MIQDGRRFPGPVELINHHKHNLDGFLTRPRIPCVRPDGVVPMAWPGISMLELEQLVIEKALSRGLQVNIFVMYVFSMDCTNTVSFLIVVPHLVVNTLPIWTTKCCSFYGTFEHCY